MTFDYSARLYIERLLRYADPRYMGPEDFAAYCRLGVAVSEFQTSKLYVGYGERKIACIKAVRACAGCGPREAKDAIEAVNVDLATTATTAYGRVPSPAQVAALGEAIVAAGGIVEDAE